MREMGFYVEQVAVENGWLLNPEENVVKKIVRGLANAQVKFGLPYCPCSIIRDQGHVCPCQDVWSDMATVGHCKCRLYYARDENAEEAEERY